MKYFVAVLFVAMSTSAFAQPNPNPTHEPARGFKFECAFEMPGVGKLPDVRCEAKGLVCKGFDIATLGGCRSGDDKLAVHCTDGFKVWDEDADVSFLNHSEISIIGNDDGRRAILLIDKERRDRHDYRFDAELVTSGDGSLFRGRGECKLEAFGRHD